jgi:hypothetical protein
MSRLALGMAGIVLIGSGVLAWGFAPGENSPVPAAPAAPKGAARPVQATAVHMSSATHDGEEWVEVKDNTLPVGVPFRIVTRFRITQGVEKLPRAILKISRPKPGGSRVIHQSAGNKPVWTPEGQFELTLDVGPVMVPGTYDLDIGMERDPSFPYRVTSCPITFTEGAAK